MLFDIPETVDELADGLPERVLGVDPEEPRDVHEHEEDVAELLLDACRVLCLERFLELGYFLVELGQGFVNAVQSNPTRAARSWRRVRGGAPEGPAARLRGSISGPHTLFLFS